jgi:hypothetical protein
MATHRTSDEVAQDFAAAMGPELGKIFNRFWNECALLHWKWNEYVILFGTKPERVDLLNAAAPGFVRIMQDALWDDVLLHISRLTDPTIVAYKETLALQRLPQLVAPAFQPHVQKLLNEVLEKSKCARDSRNRRIGHRELRLALQETTKPLDPASRKNVKEALKAIVALLNAVESHYCNSTAGYEFASAPGNAEALLYVLRDGLQARSEYYQRLSTGTLHPADHAPKPPI